MASTTKVPPATRRPVLGTSIRQLGFVLLLLTGKICCSYNASGAAIRARVGSPPTRLVTWASDKKVKDVCLEYTDVISFNSYPAWSGVNVIEH